MFASTTTDLFLQRIDSKLDILVILAGVLVIVMILDFIRRFYMVYGR